MENFCPDCRTSRRQGARFCPECQYDFRWRDTGGGSGNLPARTDQVSLSSFDPMRKFGLIIAEQHGWLRQNTLLEPMQRIIDHIALRTAMERTTDLQKEQVLGGYHWYIQEQVEQVIDQVRHARRLADARVSLQIKQRDLALHDTIAEREHQRRLGRLREEHRHEKEMLELRAQLELTNAIIQSFNQLRMIRLEAAAEGQADVEQMKSLAQVIRQSFTLLAEIDAGQLEYGHRIRELDFEHLEDARSYQLMEELVEAATDRITKGVTQFGEQSRTD